MNTSLVNAAAGVIAAAMANGKQTPAGIAVDLESAQLLQSPGTAAELEQWRATFGRRALPDALARLERAESEAERLRDRVAELEASPLGWARLLDAKSLDNFLIALGMAADTDPADGALSQVEEMIRSFRAAVSPAAVQERARTLHDHIVARDAEIERLKVRLAEGRPVAEDPHDSPLYHTYRVGHDLPQTGGAS